MNDIEILLVPILILAYGIVCYICGKGDLLNVIALMLQDKAEQLTKDIEEREMEKLTMDIISCKCGEKVDMRDIDDFVNHTKTYIIRCNRCGTEVKTIRKTGEISPKKAIIQTIQKWNNLQINP